MGAKISISELASAVNEALENYSSLLADDVKEVVKDTAESVKQDISKNAPRNTGKYAKSWSTKIGNVTSSGISMVVYSRNRYQLTHLLEHGHAKRNGGRVNAQPHIAPAEQRGIDKMVREIERRISHG